MHPGGRREKLLAGTILMGAVLVGALAWGLRSRGYRPGPGDDRPPLDGRYRQAMQVGLARDYPSARQQMLQLAKAERGSSTGAWALYQAGLAAHASGDPPAAEATFAELRRDYPDHPLALRVKRD